MEKKNNKVSSRKSLSRKVVMRDIKSLFIAAPISRITTLRDDEGRPCPRFARAASTGAPFRFGFTLIELLVVVLIIGILAAVALPQYNKVVWKSRAVQLLTMTRSLATSQEAYHMANGEYATSFAELDIDFPSLTARTTSSIGGNVASTDAVRGDDWTEIVINNTPEIFVFSWGTFIAGPYQGAGFVFGHKDNQLKQNIYCVELVDLITPAGNFCTKLFRATNIAATEWNARYYEMP